VTYALRDFRAGDADAVNRVALAAFEQYRDAYADWPAFSANIGRMAALAEHAELIVADADHDIVGAVAYVAPGRPRSALFEREWPLIRMLVVTPGARGRGIGRALTEECIRRAERDRAPLIALHTTPIMTVALPLYRRMGFTLLREAPPIHGVPYGVYVKPLRAEGSPAGPDRTRGYDERVSGGHHDQS
jgi:ribosomal protein S18 acetylase RimI-like enzyme